MEIEHEYTEDVVCPWCGYKHGDCWDWTEYSDEMKCEECGKEFSYEKEVTTTYTTSKKECEEGKHKYENDADCGYLSYHNYEDPVKEERDWEFIEIQKCSICDDKIYTKKIPREEWIKKYPVRWEMYQDWIKRDRLKYGKCDAVQETDEVKE